MGIFAAEEVTALLGEKLQGRISVNTAEITGSTNDDIKALAEGGSPEGTVMIAGEQTAGKGRLGRSFYSPKDAGLYMSILLRPAGEAADALAITTAAGASVARALDEVCGTNAGIKWVNDIYIGSRSRCGYIASAAHSCEDNRNLFRLLRQLSVKGVHGRVP